MRSNTVSVLSARTHEGATVRQLSAADELRRTVLGCLLFEDMFYEDGLSVADRISAAAAKVPLSVLTDLAKEARVKHGLRHSPLWLMVAALDKREQSVEASALIVDTIKAVCDRADLPGELLAQYWRKGRRPIPKAMKRAFAAVLNDLDEYRMAKYAARGSIRLRDILFLTHAKPKDDAQAALFNALANDALASADTWEVALSAGADKRETFTRLLNERKLGGVALLRNLRNMREAGVDSGLVRDELLRTAPRSRILPFQYIAAARAVPEWEGFIEPAMLAACADLPRLPGKTILMVDTSLSMNDKLSAKSTLNRCDAAAALAILAREVCDEVYVMAYSMRNTVVPARRGFALRDAIGRPSGGTETGRCVRDALLSIPGADRVIVFTDEQSRTPLPGLSGGTRGYVMNVGAYKNGLSWGKWIGIDGFSEAGIRFISEVENSGLCQDR